MTQALKRRVKALEAKAQPHPKHVYLSVLLAYTTQGRRGQLEKTPQRRRKPAGCAASWKSWRRS